MNAIQLEFNLLDESPEELKLSHMQMLINKNHESNGKMCRRLFYEIGEVKKLLLLLRNENEELKAKVRTIQAAKVEWDYAKGDLLFEAKEISQS